MKVLRRRRVKRRVPTVHRLTGHPTISGGRDAGDGARGTWKGRDLW
jgi:hypothetical protein